MSKLLRRIRALPWEYLALGGIITLALVLRVPGIWHATGSHPDERHMVSVVLDLSWENLNPRSFAYGSLSYYAAFFSGEALAALFPSLRSGGQGGLSYDNYFILGRSLGVSYGVLTILATYLLTRLVYRSSSAALIAALLLTTNFLHIQLSRFFTSDILLTLLTTCTLIGAVQIAQRRSRWWYVGTGVLLGLSLATKVSALYLGAPLAVALLLRWRNGERSWKTLATGAAALGCSALIALAVTQPYMYLGCNSYPHRSSSMPERSYLLCDEFVRQTAEQINMVQGKWRPPYTVQYVNTPAYLYPLQQMISYTVGWPVMIVVLVGIAGALKRAWKREFGPELILLTWCGVVFLATAGLTVKFPRYLLPIYPLLFILAGRVFGTSQAAETRQMPRTTPPMADDPFPNPELSTP